MSIRHRDNDRWFTRSTKHVQSHRVTRMPDWLPTAPSHELRIQSAIEPNRLKSVETKTKRRVKSHVVQPYREVDKCNPIEAMSTKVLLIRRIGKTNLCCSTSYQIHSTKLKFIVQGTWANYDSSKPIEQKANQGHCDETWMQRKPNTLAAVKLCYDLHCTAHAEILILIQNTLLCKNQSMWENTHAISIAVTVTIINERDATQTQIQW